MQGENPLILGLGDPLGDGPWNASVGCVNWAEHQWKAKFKGVPFAVHTDDRTGGRRVNVHEFPDREVWASENLGRRKWIADVEAYVFGDQSDLWAETLFAACNSNDDDAVGTLFLPMRVPMEARCDLVTSSWTEDALGRLTFSLRFVLEPDSAKGNVPSQSGKWRSPTHLASVVDNAAINLTNLSRDTFETDFTGDQAHSGRRQAASIIQDAARALRRAYKQARTKLVPAAKIEFNIRRMMALAEELSDSQRTSADHRTQTTLVRTQSVGRASHQAAVKGGLRRPPNPLSGYAMRASTNQVINAIGKADEGFGGLYFRSLQLLVDGATDPNDLVHALNALTGLNTTKLHAAMQTSSARSTQAELDLSDTVAIFVRRVALAYQCLATIKVAPDRQPDATLVRRRILNTLDNEMAAATPHNDVWEAFRVLRSAVTDYVAYWSSNGPATVQIKRRTVQSLAAIAADTYPKHKVVDRDRQLMRMNNIRHPLYAPTFLSGLRE